MEKLIASLLFWPGYQVANPTTTPKDVALIRQALDMLPEHPRGLVRIMEDAPDLQGMVKYDAPEDIWVSREGTHYRSEDPWKIAGTIWHENTHLKGANEPAAQRAQLEFLQSTKPRGFWAGGRANQYLKAIEEKLRRHEEMEQRGLYANQKVIRPER